MQLYRDFMASLNRTWHRRGHLTIIAGRLILLHVIRFLHFVLQMTLGLMVLMFKRPLVWQNSPWLGFSRHLKSSGLHIPLSSSNRCSLCLFRWTFCQLIQIMFHLKQNLLLIGLVCTESYFVELLTATSKALRQLSHVGLLSCMRSAYSSLSFRWNLCWPTG